MRGGDFRVFADAAAVGCRYRGTSAAPPSGSGVSGREATPSAADADVAAAFADAVRFGGDALTGGVPLDLTGDGDAAGAARVGEGKRALAASRLSPRRSAAAAADGVAPHGGRTGALGPRALPPPGDEGRPAPTVWLPSARYVVSATLSMALELEPNLLGDVRTR